MTADTGEAAPDLSSIYRSARRRLADAGVPTPDFDARLLIEWAGGLSQLDLIRYPETAMSKEASARIHSAIRRRAGGEPVHRIIGQREFYGIGLELTPETLEPRPDTETLVDLALPFLRERIAEHGTANLLDLGTGSGAIAIALLAQLRELTAVGADIAPGALDAARRNSARTGVTRRFAALESDWFSAVAGRYDLVISNPPYISSREIASLPAEVRCYDPIEALDGGADGLDAYRVIAGRVAGYLAPDGAVMVEIGHQQKNEVAGLFQGAGFRLDRVARDLAGTERALVFRQSRFGQAG